MTEDVDALVNRASVALRQDELEKAVELLHQALKLDPQSAGAMVTLANCLDKQNRPEEALRWFERAVETDPHQYAAHSGLGWLLVRLKRPNEGIEHLHRAVELNPTYAFGYKLLANIYQVRGDLQRAEAYKNLALLFGGKKRP